MTTNTVREALQGVLPGETVLQDDYPVYGNYLYVADGKVIMSDLHDSTVGRLKAYLGAKEIRRCDIEGRRVLIEAAGTPPSRR